MAKLMVTEPYMRILFTSIIIAQRKNSTQQSKNLRMHNIIMYVRILIMATNTLRGTLRGCIDPVAEIKVVVLQKSLTTTQKTSINAKELYITVIKAPDA